jgi:hypothetical protein
MSLFGNEHENVVAQEIRQIGGCTVIWLKILCCELQ